MKARLDMLEREGVHRKYLDYAVEENEKMRKFQPVHRGDFAGV